MHRLLPIFLLTLGCKSEPQDADDTDVEGPSDFTGDETNVNTYWPEGYTPAAPARLILAGDSITAGDGENNWDLLYKELLKDNVSNKWPGFDDVNLATTFPDLTDVVDVSRGGATTDTMLDSQLPKLEEDEGFTWPMSGETLVVFTIGGNDLQAALAPLYDADEIADQVLANVKEIVDFFQDPAHFPDGAWIYVTNVYEPSDGTGYNPDCFFGIQYTDRLPALDRYNRLLREMGEEKGFSVVDLRGHFLGHGHNYTDTSVEGYDAFDNTLWMLDDCIHPNKRGHHEVRRLFRAAITNDVLQRTLPE